MLQFKIINVGSPNSVGPNDFSQALENILSIGKKPVEYEIPEELFSTDILPLDIDLDGEFVGKSGFNKALENLSLIHKEPIASKDNNRMIGNRGINNLIKSTDVQQTNKGKNNRSTKLLELNIDATNITEHARHFSGKVSIITTLSRESSDNFKAGEILVAKNIDPDFKPLLAKAGLVITTNATPHSFVYFGCNAENVPFISLSEENFQKLEGSFITSANIYFTDNEIRIIAN
ncbi:MAG: hypothetical protein A2Y40_06215 [Candidatus Margulisbacteria bacterium GWF2_35_9]|nr:MAG: hypothetical protein A2Y40_06215 [Candidatus Margulisbacteria bacterium GWF2_35_9]